MNPGSPEAVANGCQCAVFDNHHGKGFKVWDKRDVMCFWINETCPIHGVRDAYEQTEQTAGCMDLERL